MRRKRLQHVADTVCHMFSGWRLLGDYDVLQKLGSGRLALDVLSERSTFDGTPLQPLVIAAELNAWVRQDLAEHGIALDAIESITLDVDLLFRRVAAGERVTTRQHLTKGRTQSPAEFVVCEIESHSRVATDETVYEGRNTDVEEWPEKWAKDVAAPRHRNPRMRSGL